MEPVLRIRLASRTAEQLREHYRACHICQRAGFYPTRSLWNHLTARRGPGYDYGDGSESWCAEGRRLHHAHTIAQTFVDETGNWPLKVWNGLVSVWEVVTGH